MSKDKGTYSSFPEQEILQEGWKDFVTKGAQKIQKAGSNFLKKGTSGNYKRQASEPGQVLEPDPAPDPTPGTDPTPAPEPTPQPTPTPAGGDTGIPISGTEYQVMEFIAGAKILDIIKDAIGKTLGKGKWREDPEQKSMASNFMRVFIPSFMKAAKNPNIDIAENTQIAEFMLEYLTEAGQADTQREPLSKGTVRSKKGNQRSEMGMQGYLKPLGTGKPPVLANQISRALEAALTKAANADSINKAVIAVANSIKDKKRGAQYLKQQEAIFAKNPEERVRQYKENVTALVGSVSALAAAAAASALSSIPAAAEAPSAEIQKAIDLLKKGDVPGAMEILGGGSSAEFVHPFKDDPVSRSGGAARDRMSARASQRAAGSSSAFHAREGTIKTFKITKEGKVKKVNNEKK